MLENDVNNKTSFSFQTLKTFFSNLLKSYVNQQRVENTLNF